MTQKTSRRTIALWTASALALALATASAEVAADAEARAEKEATRWLALVDQGDYAQTWKDAAPVFQEHVTEAHWVLQMKSAAAMVGKNESRKLEKAVHRTELPHVPKGDYLVLEYLSSFADKKSIHEIVTLSPVDGQWKVVGYWLR